MPFSPFQQPSSRQNALASLIRSAEDRGDHRQLVLLQSQWVHRYGVGSLPGVLVSAEVEIAEATVTENPVVDDSIAESVAESSEALDLQGAVARCEDMSIAAASETSPAEAATEEDRADPDQESRDMDAQFGFESVLDDSPAVIAAGDVDRSFDESKESVRPQKPPTAVFDGGRTDVPAPPLSTPRTLRRWLPDPGVDLDFPQAS